MSGHVVRPGSGALNVTGHAPAITVGMVLDVRVLNRKVGTLKKLGDEFVFQYDAGVAPEHFVSLAMPVRMQAWVWPRDLHRTSGRTCPKDSCCPSSVRSSGRCSTAPICPCWPWWGPPLSAASR